MSFEEITGIEGLEGKYHNVDLENDTSPGATLVKFEAYVEKLTGLTEKEGRDMEETRIKVVVTRDLGNFEVHLPLNDKVHYDNEKKKWVIDKLFPGSVPYQGKDIPNSHILHWKDAWNAFARGTAGQDIGTPLIVLFRHDPARASMYERHQVMNMEQLAALNEDSCSLIGMGALDDRNRARSFIAKAKEQAPFLQMDRKFEEFSKKIQAKDEQIADLTAKLTELLESKPKKGKPGRKAGFKVVKQISEPENLGE